MALPTYVGLGTAATGTTTASPGMPGGLSNGDLLIMFAETSDASISASSGWIEAPNSPVVGTSYGIRLGVWYQWYNGTAPARTVTVGGDHVIARIAAFRGLNKSGNPFTFVDSTTGSTSSSASFPGGTAKTPDSMAVIIGATSRDTTSTAFWSSWANSDFANVTERAEASTTTGDGGGIVLTTAERSSTGTFGATTATVSLFESQWVGWIALVSANLVGDVDAGQLTLTGQEGFFGYMSGDAGSLTLAGGDAILTTSQTTDADVEALALAGEDATFTQGVGILGDSSALSIAGGDATFVYNVTLDADAGGLTLAGGDGDILAPTPEVFRMGVMVDLIPTETGDGYQRYTERLRFNGSTIPVRSWSFNQSEGELGGRLTVELANVEDRALLDHNTPITFEVGHWDGTQFVYTTLLDTGKLLTTQYNVSANGIGPSDTFTIQAASRMEDALNLAPNNNIVYYDPTSITADVGDFEGIYEINGTYTPPDVNSVSGLTWQYLLDEIPGFDAIRTNIPDFPIKMVQFQAGVPYINAVAGIVGMFEPILSAIDEDGMFVLYIQDGTSVIASGMPTPREVTISKATSLGISDEVPRIGGLIINVASNRKFFDYIETRTETETDVTQEPGGPYLETVTVTTFFDFYRYSNPDEPIKSEIARQQVTQYSDNWPVNEVSDKYFYDSVGNLTGKNRTVYANVPEGPQFALAWREVSTETEKHFYAVHPFDINQIYRTNYYRFVEGMYYIDEENPQLDEPYKKYAVDAFRAGNVNEDMIIDRGPISTYSEAVRILRKNQVKIVSKEIDHLSGQVSVDEEITRDGAVGSNGYVDEQRRYYIYREGQTELNGQVEQVNMGELPFTMAVALGKKILRNREHASERVSFNLIGIDASLVRGMAINPKGRNGEDLGNYIIDSRSFQGSEQGYSMTIDARSAKRN